MSETTLQLPGFQIMGIAIRTTNQDFQSTKDIGELWERFVKEDIFAKIPDKISTDIYCVYMDYENQGNGHYTTVIGARVSGLDHLAEAFIGKTIPAASYKRYLSKGKIPECVQKTWEKIWASGVKRKWQADFDLYGTRARDMDNGEVETYLSIP